MIKYNKYYKQMQMKKIILIIIIQKKINLFNYKNNNIDKLIKQNIYEERFQNKNVGYFLYLKKENKNSINSLENTASNSHNKTKKFFTQLVSPNQNKKKISTFLNDYKHNNNIKKYKNTETINFDRNHNDFSLNNNSNDSKTTTINKNNIETSPIHENKFKNINKNKMDNIINKNKSTEQKNKFSNYTDYNNSINNSNDLKKYYSYNKIKNNNLKYNNNDYNTMANSVINNINVICEIDNLYKNKIENSSNKNYQKNDNY